jgi:hypothetical protein
MTKFTYEIIDERTHEIVFSGIAEDVEEVWKTHFIDGDYPEHYLLVWHNEVDLSNINLN